MRIATSLFCEYQATTREGKLDAGGILNLVWSTTFPMSVTQLSFVVTLEMEREEEWGWHTFTLVLRPDTTDERDQLLNQPFRADGRFHRSVIDLSGLSFPGSGVYRFHVLVDGHDLGDATLIVSDHEPHYPVGPEMIIHETG
jgi:hypothetical protein